MTDDTLEQHIKRAEYLASCAPDDLGVGEMERLELSLRTIIQALREKGAECERLKTEQAAWMRNEERQDEQLAEAEARASALVEAADWFARHSQSIQTDVASAHANRGNGASQWMREDDREFRRDLREALASLKAAHDAALNGGAE